VHRRSRGGRHRIRDGDRELRAFLSGTSAANPLVFAGAATLMIAVALAATFLPAWRATQVDPVIALWAE